MQKRGKQVDTFGLAAWFAKDANTELQNETAVQQLNDAEPGW